MSAYRYGQSVTLPKRLWSKPDVPQTATVRLVDEINRSVQVMHAGYIQTISFEELDAAVSGR